MAVSIYTTPSCSYCRVAKDYFRKSGISFSEYDISADPRLAEEMMRKSGQFGVPVIDINGRVIVGFNQVAIERALHR
ncbi:MAG: glutaredoxin domain-containing protein [Spirochaetaceae bacterium]|nr:glutaredoxin domain-containing protein [Spirochaetaceae bacterium]